ncbi:hypothetical protein [Nocardia sp. NPDC057455]|uniref:hypothetical protein n=1 Tax=Nocardia sp. NPDC057455 TaxID=3346138 RepID=UPI0036721A98
MDSSSSTRQYTVRSPFAHTGLTCAPEVAEQVHHLAAPYLTLDQGAAEPGAWRVVANPPPRLDATVAETVTAQGEVAVEYAVDHADRVLFHVAPRSDAWITQSVLRATRAVHRCAAGRQGVLFLHAGLVELNGIGVALVGGSRAGKTSFIMASVLNGSGVMVCNDDVSIAAHADRPGVIGTGWPRSISVRLDTLELLFGRDRAEEIRSSLSHPANETLPTLRDSGVEPHGTALLYPWEYADILHTKIGQSTKVDALVYLSLADDPAEVDLAAVPQAASTELLSERILRLPNKHLNIFGHEPSPGSVERTRRALTALPSFRFRYDFRDVHQQVDRLADYLSGRI